MPIGIDIGSHSVKIAEVKRTGNSYVLTRVAQFWLEPEKGDLARSRVAKVLRDLSMKLALAGEKAVLGMTGKDLNLRYFHFPYVSTQNVHSLVEYEVESLVGKSDKGLAFDSLVLNLPREDVADVCALVALAKDDVLEEKITSLAPSRVRVSYVCPNSIALLNSYVTSEQFSTGETTMLLDIGAENMDVAIQRDGGLIFARNASFGGKNFTEALSKTFETPFEVAERVKRAHGEVLRPHAKKKSHPVSSALSSAAAQFCSLVQSTIAFCKTQTNLPNLQVDRILLSGGGARLSGLAEYMEPSLGIPVTIFNPLSGIMLSSLPPEKREVVIRNAPHYAVALGLAKLAVRRAPFALSLLPEKALKRKELMATKPFMLAAGASLLLAIIATWLASGREISHLMARENSLKNVITRTNDEERQFQKIHEKNLQLCVKAAELKNELARTSFLVEALAALYCTVIPKVWIARIEMPDTTLTRAYSLPATDPDTLLVEGFVEESSNSRQTLADFVVALEKYPTSQYRLIAKVENALDTEAGNLRFVISLARGEK